ncbi:MAG: TraR/DksA C4-type zinc finger protein [Actinomycetota bacterium]|nr:TraR/DksA C4-type zinc finger protein [Actinomycetota bacterium]
MYGICSDCGQSIALERLVTLPAARTCTGCAFAAQSPLRRC